MVSTGNFFFRTWKYNSCWFCFKIVGIQYRRLFSSFRLFLSAPKPLKILRWVLLLLVIVLGGSKCKTIETAETKISFAKNFFNNHAADRFVLILDRRNSGCKRLLKKWFHRKTTSVFLARYCCADILSQKPGSELKRSLWFFWSLTFQSIKQFLEFYSTVELVSSNWIGEKELIE